PEAHSATYAILVDWPRTTPVDRSDANPCGAGARLSCTRYRGRRTAHAPPQAAARLSDAHDALRRSPGRRPRGLRVSGRAEPRRNGRLGVGAEGAAWPAPLRRLGVPREGPRPGRLLERHPLLAWLRRARARGWLRHHRQSVRDAVGARARPVPARRRRSPRA